uniref:LuxR C-terminal-related transcriptional regulator n=1 Tax=uncultured Caballeronia sp. TaxID=1827198 RepID=UPI0035CA0A3D
AEERPLRSDYEFSRGIPGDNASRGAVIAQEGSTKASEELASLVTLAFHMAPVGLLVARARVIVLCNQMCGDTFGYSPSDLTGRSLECLYPSIAEFHSLEERAARLMRETGVHSDDRIMRKFDASRFWCHVSGRAIDRDDPFAAAVWSFEDITSVRRVAEDITRREQEIAQLLVIGKSSKGIARDLRISYRTVQAHRARLMRKFNVSNTAELMGCLFGRQ